MFRPHHRCTVPCMWNCLSSSACVAQTERVDMSEIKCVDVEGLGGVLDMRNADVEKVDDIIFVDDAN